MDNFPLDHKVNFDSEFNSLLQDKVLFLDGGEIRRQIDRGVISALGHQGQGFQNNFPGVALVHHHGAAPLDGVAQQSSFVLGEGLVLLVVLQHLVNGLLGGRLVVGLLLVLVVPGGLVLRVRHRY